MRIVYSPSHSQHASPAEVFNGHREPHQEVPARVDRIMSALIAEGYEVTPVTETLSPDRLSSVHDQRYIRFLETFQPVAEDYTYPSVFGLHAQPQFQNTNHLVQLGYHSFDMYTPVGPKTFQAALSSAACAIQVAQEVANKQELVGYALCRPPGHHAERNQMGGYCYLNNAALAAATLLEFSPSNRVATLDVDFHHGNGTQHIFYERSDVFTASIHADPNWKFPFFSGFENERGQGKGDGYNLNTPLGAGATNTEYQEALETILQSIESFHPEYLVVSFGADTHQSDPIGGFGLTTSYFTTMAESISQLNVPTVIVQEGGYNTDLLGTNVAAFLKGFK